MITAEPYNIACYLIGPSIKTTDYSKVILPGPPRKSVRSAIDENLKNFVEGAVNIRTEIGEGSELYLVFDTVSYCLHYKVLFAYQRMQDGTSWYTRITGKLV